MRRLLLVLAAALALAVPAAAGAAQNVRFGLQDDAWLAYGPGTLQSRLNLLDRLGVRLVRFNAHWSEIAVRRPAHPALPTDPAYRWTTTDAVLDGLHAHGIDVVLGLVETPRWANGGQSPNWAPLRGSDFASFAAAIARRYPFVHEFLIWNEPNQARWLRPTLPAVYVSRLLNPAYTAIHNARAGALVAGGVTSPRGGPTGVAPLTWLAGMKAAGAHLDAYAHHPYPSRPRQETPFAGGCVYCSDVTMATLPRLLSAVQKAWGAKPVWLTEFGYQTNPPDPILGVPPALQARYVGEAALRAYELPHVTMLIHYLLRDEPQLDRFQSGLETANGTAKPSLAAFELPLAQMSRSGGAVRVWGAVRPGKGARAYRLQVLRGGAWTWLGGVRRTGAAGMLTGVVSARPGQSVRLWAPGVGFGFPVPVT